jgi:branched-chain amino acid transport system permease protein
MDAGLLAQYIMNGLMLGMMYALVAVGFTLFFGVLDIIKFSHGDVLTVGAFTALATYVGLQSAGIGASPVILLVMLVVAIFAMAALGMLIARALVLPLRSAPALNTLLITLMLGTVLRESVGCSIRREPIQNRSPRCCRPRRSISAISTCGSTTP